jgi:adenylate cyclase class 2
MTKLIEREIKLRFSSTAEARHSISVLNATPLRTRRLQDDRLLDWPDGRLRKNRCSLRIRDEVNSSFLTFKGPPKLDTMKLREEIETTVDDAMLLLEILKCLGLQVWFRYQKYREELQHNGIIIAIDETPIGTFVELEGEKQGIIEIANFLGRKNKDYLVDSYLDLFVKSSSMEDAKTIEMIFDQKS